MRFVDVNKLVLLIPTDCPSSVGTGEVVLRLVLKIFAERERDNIVGWNFVVESVIGGFKAYLIDDNNGRFKDETKRVWAAAELKRAGTIGDCEIDIFDGEVLFAVVSCVHWKAIVAGRKTVRDDEVVERNGVMELVSLLLRVEVWITPIGNVAERARAVRVCPGGYWSLEDWFVDNMDA